MTTAPPPGGDLPRHASDGAPRAGRPRGRTAPTELIPVVVPQPDADVVAATDPEGLVPGAQASSLGRNSLILTIGTFASRATGQVRTMLLVAAIGITGTVADAFDIANTLPNMLYALLAAGVLQAVLMPQIMRALKAANTQERLDKLLTLAAAALVVGTTVLTLAAPLLIRLFTLSDQWSPQARALAVVFGFWCIPQVLFYGLFSVLGEVLNARGQFAATGWAPMANNIVSVVGFGAYILVWGRADGPLNDVGAWTTAQTVVLAGTATLGVASQTAILLAALRRGGFRWRLRFGLRGIGLRSASKVVGWTIAAVALEQLGLVLLKNITSSAGQSAPAGAVVAGNATFSNALTIYLLPHSLVVVSIITALFPRMSLAAAERDLDGVRSAMSTGLRVAGIFSVLSAAVLVTIPGPVLKSLLPTLSAEEVAVGAPVLRALALGLVALGATVMVKRMYFAFEDGRSIFVIQVFATSSMVLTLLLASQVLPARHWAVAAAGAYALSAWVSVLLRIRGMRRLLHGIDGARVLRLYVRAGLAALVAAVLGWVAARLLGTGHALTWGHAVGVTALAGLVMLAAYVALLKVLRVRELDDALRPVLRRLGR